MLKTPTSKTQGQTMCTKTIISSSLNYMTGIGSECQLRLTIDTVFGKRQLRSADCSMAVLIYIIKRRSSLSSKIPAIVLSSGSGGSRGDLGRIV